jgi:hypothetical protein
MSSFARKMARKQMRAGGGLMRRTSRDHLAVLQGIERVFVDAWRASRAIDDGACHDAIMALLMHRPAEHPIVAILGERLLDVRQTRWESDETWEDALRVVAKSIRNHSARQPGETGYLEFVGMFLA